MAIYVYHNPDFLEFYRGAGEGTPDLHRLYLAAIVETDEPEAAYRFMQHLGMDWYDHPNVITVVHSRSTSVGDVLETEDGRLLLVAPFGFTELPDASLPAARSLLIQALHAFAADENNQAEVQDQLAWKVRHLYMALLFAVSVLETLADEEARPNPQQALLARFATEQARWALTQADGGQ
jgi:hypothetical protein